MYYLLELIPDDDMYLFFDKRHEREFPNNKYLKSHDSKQESKDIIYLDKNNLYGYVMSEFLPTNGFSWIDPKQFHLKKYTSNSSNGCVLEVD